MLKVHPLAINEIFKPEVPELMHGFYESSMLTRSVSGAELIGFSDYLSFCRMDATSERPPGFFIIGKQASSRDVYGDHWADNVHKTQKSPIKKLDHVSAGGYMNSLAKGANLDLVEFKDDFSQGTYRRLIVPYSTSPNSSPLFFAMFCYFECFDCRQHDTGYLYSNRQAKNLH